MADSTYSTMGFLTYSPGKIAGPEYEEWLRAVDNPFFNSRPGIAEYSNWKVVGSTAKDLPFTHFDFLGLDGPGMVEAVWFDHPLDEFRRDWVEKWGYAGGPPAAENQYAYLLERLGGSRDATAMHVVVTAAPAVAPPSVASGEAWQLTSLLRKHWAIGRAAAGEPWRLQPAAHNPLKQFSFHIQAIESARDWQRHVPAAFGDQGFALCAGCLASPSRPIPHH